MGFRVAEVDAGGCEGEREGSAHDGRPVLEA